MKNKSIPAIALSSYCDSLKERSGREMAEAFEREKWGTSEECGYYKGRADAFNIVRGEILRMIKELTPSSR